MAADFINILTDIRDTKYPDIVTKHGEIEEDRAEVESNKQIVADDKDTVSQYKTDALNAKNLAENYANANEDVEVEAGKYSSKHYALKAEATKGSIDTSINTFVNTTVPTKTTEFNNNATTKTDEYNTNHTSKLAVIQGKVDEASASASTATNKASEATSQAVIATQKASESTAIRNELVNLSTQAIQLTSSSQPSVTYNSQTGVLTIGIPQGLKGDRGEAFSVNASGYLANRTAYDGASTGFSYLSIDTDPTMVYFKKSDTNADWSVGVPFGKGDKGDTGDTGNGIQDISFVGTTDVSGLSGKNGATDTYRVTYTDSTTFDYVVYNGLDGNAIVSISQTAGNGSAGTVDTYTIEFSNGSSFSFDVYNGADMTNATVIDDESIKASGTWSSQKISLTIEGMIDDEVPSSSKVYSSEEVESKIAPIGSIITMVANIVPIGYLECNGAEISRTSYSGLYSVLGDLYGSGDGSTTFNLPDFRGEFLRGFDNGRGIDSGRTIGSSQDDDNKSHTHTTPAHSHTGSTSTSGGHSHDMNMKGDSSLGTNIVTGTSDTSGESLMSGKMEVAGEHSHSLTIDSGGDGVTNSSGTEARPRNIAVMYCIKY